MDKVIDSERVDLDDDSEVSPNERWDDDSEEESNQEEEDESTLSNMDSTDDGSNNTQMLDVEKFSQKFKEVCHLLSKCSISVFQPY